jgi:hypothetical protein
MGQGAPFPVNELAGTPYFWSNATHCSGDSLTSFTFIGTPVVVWLRSMPEQAVKPCSKKPSDSREASTAGGFFQQGKRKVGVATNEAVSRRKETLRGSADRFRFDEATKVRRNRR